MLRVIFAASLQTIIFEREGYLTAHLISEQEDQAYDKKKKKKKHFPMMVRCGNIVRVRGFSSFIIV